MTKHKRSSPKLNRSSPPPIRPPPSPPLLPRPSVSLPVLASKAAQSSPAEISPDPAESEAVVGSSSPDDLPQAVSFPCVSSGSPAQIQPPSLHPPTASLHGSDPAAFSSSTDGLGSRFPADNIAALGFTAQEAGSNSAQVNGLEAPVNGSEASGFMASVDGSAPIRGSSPKSLGAWTKKLNLRGVTNHQHSRSSVEQDLSKSLDKWPTLKESVNASKIRETKGKYTATDQTLESPILPPSSEISRPTTVESTTRFPWAAKMNPASRNLYRAAEPTFLKDGTPQVKIPTHVFQEGLENQKEYIIGQFYRCSAPSGGLTHAVVNRIWGRNCRIFTKKLSDSTFLFHIPDESTRSWVLQRILWHVDDCLMFVAQWNPSTTLELPEISTVPVWVTLRNIPTTLYSIKALSWIASGVGEPMLSYKPRLDPTEIGKAKVMVEVELSKPFPQKVSVTDDMGLSSLVDVEYAWIPSKCKGCNQLGHKLSRCLNRQPSGQNTLPESQELVNVVSKNIVTEDSLTHTTTPNVAITPTEVAISSTPAETEETMIAPPTTKASKTQEANQKQVAQQGNSSKDAPEEPKNTNEARDETPPENLQVLLVETESLYSSSDDTLDENKHLEETLQRKSTRNTKPTLKAKEMQRSGNKGRQGKGRKGRSHR